MNNDKKTNPRKFRIMRYIQLLLILLKVIGKVQLTWWEVFTPTYISLAFILIVFLIYLIGAIKVNNTLD